jgi:transposase-like protein
MSRVIVRGRSSRGWSKVRRRPDGVDQVVLSLTARGLTTGEVSAHVAEVYGARA